MKSIRAILIVFLFTNLCLPQTGWYQVNSGTNKSLLSVHFINLNTGFTTGISGTVLVTSNTGTTWHRINLGDSTYSLKKVYFKDQLTGFILGQSPIPPSPGGDTLHSRVYKTTDGGLHWVVDQPRILDVFLNNIQFVNSTTGYMSGGLYSMGPNKFFKTTNGGNSWIEINTNVWSAIVSQEFTNVNTGYLGIMNKIYKTTNGGENWNIAYENPQGEFHIVNSIKFINPNTGFACGGYMIYPSPKNRFIMKTSDAGNTWQYLLNDTLGEMVNNILVMNEGLIYGCGSALSGGVQSNSAYIIRSTNGGASWSNEAVSPQNPLYNMINSNTAGFAVGYNGTIYKKNNVVSITQISTEVPSSINLYQNYPNPFNPETTIKFDLAKAGFISLKVYDISGKEVQNLFNGVKEAGSYQLKFDGANLNSGVYFYRLLTNGATITKSMVLVK